MRHIIEKAKKEESGAIVAFLACIMVLLVLIMALTIDLGNTYLEHLRMRNATDLAAEAIGLQLPVPYSAANEAMLRNTAETILQQNGIDLSDATLQCEILNGSGYIYAARVILENDVNHNFANLYINKFSNIRVGLLVYAEPNDDAETGYTVTVVDS